MFLNDPWQRWQKFYGEALGRFKGTDKKKKRARRTQSKGEQGYSSYATLVADHTINEKKTLKQNLKTFIEEKILSLWFRYRFIVRFFYALKKRDIKAWNQELDTDMRSEMELFHPQKIHLLIYEPGYVFILTFLLQIVLLAIVCLFIYAKAISIPGYEIFLNELTPQNAMKYFALLTWASTLWLPFDAMFISTRLFYYKPKALTFILVLNISKIIFYLYLFTINLFFPIMLGYGFFLWDLIVCFFTRFDGPSSISAGDVYPKAKQGKEVKRRFGRGQITAHAARAHSLKYLPLDENGIQIGLHVFSLEEITTHVYVLGRTGAGKTSILRTYARDIVANIYHGSKKRLFLYDYQNNCQGILRLADLKCKVFVLNPYDHLKGSAWDIAKDCYTRDLSKKFAEYLIPVSDNTKDKFFSTSAQAILIDMMTILRFTTKGNYDLRDLILLARNYKLLFGVMLYFDIYFNQNPTNVGGDPIALLSMSSLGRGKALSNTENSILLTLQTHLNNWSGLAAVSHEKFKKGHLVSIKDWLETESVLILGNSFKSEEYMIPLHTYIIELMFSTAMEPNQIEERADDDENYTFCMLDEAPSLKHSANTINRMLTQGRQKHISVLMTTLGTNQTIGLFGSKEAAISADDQFKNRVVLKCSKAEAPIASEMIGGYISTDDKEITVATPQDLVDMPSGDKRKKWANGVKGYYCGEDFIYYYDYRFRNIDGQQRIASSRRKGKILAPYQRVPEEYENIRGFSEADIQRLGLDNILKFMISEKIITRDEIPQELKRYADYVPPEIDAEDEDNEVNTKPSLQELYDTVNDDNKHQLERNIERMQQFNLEFPDLLRERFSEITDIIDKLGLGDDFSSLE